MGFSQDFSYDVFISYAHLNNQAPGPLDKGWVTDLHEVLRMKLAERLYTEPAIWRDDGGLDGKTITDGIQQALQNSAIFLAVVSGAFLQSTYCCPVELAGFSHPKFPLNVRGFSRIVVAAYDALCDIPVAGWPAPLGEVQAVEFCPVSGLPLTRPLRSDPTEPYWQKVNELARKIQAVLVEVKKGLGGAEVSTLSPPAAVQTKSPAAWRARWQKPMVTINYREADRSRAENFASGLAGRCDFTLLPSDVPADRQRVYLQNSDGQILLFDCRDRTWAEDQALFSLRTAVEQGRPKRLGIVTQCPDEFALHSEFVVPLSMAAESAESFISSLQETRA